MGLDTNEDDLEVALKSLIKDMANEKQKQFETKAEKNGKPFEEDHPILKAKKAIDDVAEKYGMNK